MGKRFQDLDLSNAFLFAAALEDPQTCRLVLEIIPGRKVESIFELLQDLGKVPEDLKKQIESQTDLETLSRWLKPAYL